MDKASKFRAGSSFFVQSDSTDSSINNIAVQPETPGKKVEEQPEIDIGLDDTKLTEVFTPDELAAKNQEVGNEMWKSEGKLNLV